LEKEDDGTLKFNEEFGVDVPPFPPFFSFRVKMGLIGGGVVVAAFTKGFEFKGV
jgi:hypothetical protein